MNKTMTMRIIKLKKGTYMKPTKRLLLVEETFYIQVVSRNHKVMLESQPYQTKFDADRAICLLQNSGLNLPITIHYSTMGSD